MADLIDRQAAIDALREVYEYEYPTASGGFDEYATKLVPNTLKNLPSAQPEITLESAIDYLHSIGWMQEHDRALTERKTGRWKGEGMGDYRCSWCGEVSHPKTNFCPNCGADMRGGVDGADGNG